MPSRRTRWTLRCLAAAVLAFAFSGAPGAEQQAPDRATPSADPPYRTLVSTYCVSCHNSKVKAGSLQLDAINTQDLSAHHEAWEKVALKLRAHQMPPQGARQPAEAAHAAALTSLEAALDGLSASHPNPGRTDTFRRLNRTEYRNAIRDLLALDVDVAALLPSDSASFGFDNVTVGNCLRPCSKATSRQQKRSASLPWAGQACRWGVQPFGSNPTSRRKDILKVCLSGRAAARWSRTRFP